MTQSKRIAIIGAGGFAREVAWLISDMGHDRSVRERSETMEVAGFLVSDPGKVSERDSEILGDLTWLEKNRVGGLAMGVGSPEVRLRLGQELKRRFPRIPWPALIQRRSASCWLLVNLNSGSRRSALTTIRSYLAIAGVSRMAASSLMVTSNRPVSSRIPER